MAVEIADWNDLDNVRNDLTGDYVLVNDLDSETDGYAGIGDDWSPIAVPGFDGTPFSGSFDGDEFAIKDFVLGDPRDEGGNGLFGGVEGTDPSLMNILVSGVYSGVYSEDFAGGLVENLSISGVINLTGFNGDPAFAGGLAGAVSDGSNGTIQNCVAHVDLTSDGDSVGGLVGEHNGQILESYATGSVEGDDRVGGLVGRNFFTVKESYAMGSVEGEARVGGLVGENLDTVEDSYATGSVEGDDRVGGLVGDDSFGLGTTVDSYWDTETTGQSTSAGGTGLTTSEMQGSEAETNMDGFDFSDVWNSVLESDSDTTADGYPILLALDRENQLEAQGIFQGGELQPPQPPENLTAELL